MKANTKKEFQFTMDCYIKLIRTYVDVAGMTIKDATAAAHEDVKSGQFEKMVQQAIANI